MSQTPLPPRDPSRPPVESGLSGPPPLPPPGYGPMMFAPPPPKRTSIFSRILVSLVTSAVIFSIILNIYLGAYFAASIKGPSETEYQKGDATKRIVILPITGVINDGAAEFAREALHALREDPPAAIVLRVDSPGGGVSASDRIWHEITVFRKETNIPIIASYGSLAASGGYYVSAPADYIIAEPTCITGSIGVIAPIMTFSGTMEKLGVTPETIVATQSPKKDVANNPLRPWTEADRAEVRGLLDHAYERFVTVVAEGRTKHLKPDEVRALANGSVYTAEQAVQNKLVDAQGYLSDAIDKAKSAAGFPAGAQPRITIMHVRQGFSLARLLGASGPSIPVNIDAEQVRSWIGELSAPRLEYSYRP
ncbi:MAG: signal peptide peptidase SppA [Planctomycetes bacterium]|nr:signal peptide peptidase SppA [Planctomycetota bacterium]